MHHHQRSRPQYVGPGPGRRPCQPAVWACGGSNPPSQVLSHQQRHRNPAQPRISENNQIYFPWHGSIAMLCVEDMLSHITWVIDSIVFFYFASAHSPYETWSFPGDLWCLLHDVSKIRKKEVFEELAHTKPITTAIRSAHNSPTHHHIQRKCTLWLEVLQLAQYGEHFLFPHLYKYQLMDQNWYLKSKMKQVLNCIIVFTWCQYYICFK